MAARWLLGLALAGLAAQAQAQSCAPPPALFSTIPAGILNDYYSGGGQATVSPGAKTLVLGTRDPRGFGATLAVGDLLMIIQMQDGTINSSNNSTYGNGTGSGQGSLSVGSAGLYEWVRVTDISVSNVTFTPALAYAYAWADATASTAQRRYQVVRVPQFDNGTVAGVTAPTWDGTTGGVVSFDVRGTLTLGSAVIEGESNRAIFAAGKGFRGGLSISSSVDGTANITTDYVISSLNAGNPNYHASKGEGIIGTPRAVAVKNNGWGFRTNNPPGLTDVLNTFEGLPGGSYARGAPGNAGGGGVDSDRDGGNSNNSGGGGGGNYGPGGLGGRPWNDPLLDLGGRGGAGYSGTLAFNRVFMGGGGGAGGTNNGTADTAVYTNQGMSCTLGAGRCSSGAAGGGIVVLRARSITGSGVIDVRGAHGYNVLNDAAGGGGAGGSVVIETVFGGNATIEAQGGDGGNAWAGDAGWPGGRHGPGGGGGGGFVAFAPNSMAITANIAGGTPGESMSNPPGPGREYYGGSGFNGGFTTFQVPNTPGVPQAALCFPNLQLRKTNGVTQLTSPGTSVYTFTVRNLGLSASSGTVTVADKLPPGLTVTPGPLTAGGPSGGSWSCNAANSTDITCTTNSSIAANGSLVFTLSTTINGTNGLAVVNRALVSGGGDLDKTTPATPALAETCTADDSPNGCAVDADTLLAPNLAVSKSDSVTVTVPGALLVYTLNVGNLGAAATSSTLTVADWMSDGLSFSGTSPFVSGGFTCTGAGRAVLCDRSTPLAAGTTATLTFTAVVGSDPPTAITNRVQIGGGGDPNQPKSTRPTTSTAALCAAPVEPADTASDVVTGCASDTNSVQYVRLQMTKDDGAVFVSLGGQTDYVFTITNIGTAPTTGTLVFADLLPTMGTGTLGFAATGSFTPAGANGANWSCTNSTGTYTYCVSNTSIPAGGVSVFQLTVNLSSTLPVGTQTLNRARVGGGGDLDAPLFNTATSSITGGCIANGNPAGCAIDLNTVQNAPEIRVSKSHPDPQARSPGDTFNMILRVTNTGGTAAATSSIRLTDVAPVGMTINSVTPSSPFTCAAVSSGGRVTTCTNSIGAMAANSVATVTLSVTVGAAATNGDYRNRALVTATGDPQNSTQTTTVTAAVCAGTGVPLFGCAADVVPLNADIQVTKAQRTQSMAAFQITPLTVNQAVTTIFRIDVSNAAGSAAASTVTFSDLIPFAFSSLVVGTTTGSGGATGCSAALAGNQLTGTITSLPASGNCRFEISAVPTAMVTNATNTVVVDVPSGINDTNTANNSASVLTTVLEGIANLSVTKTDGRGTVTTGQTTSYTLTVANGGPAPADGARVYDPPTAGLSCTSVSCTASGAAQCPVGLTLSQLQNSTPPLGANIPLLRSGGSLTIVVNCQVTATGQ